MLLHDNVLKHHPFATSLPVRQVPSKIGQKNNSCYIASWIAHCLERHLVPQIITHVLQKAFSCLLSLLHLSIIDELKSPIVNQRLQFLLPSIIIATYHNLQTSLFEPAEGNLYFLRGPSGWLTQAKNINAGYINVYFKVRVSLKSTVIYRKIRFNCVFNVIVEFSVAFGT